MPTLRLCLTVAVASLTVLVLMQLSVQGPQVGRVLFGLGSHGLHTGDLPALAIWAVGTAACVIGWRRT